MKTYNICIILCLMAIGLGVYIDSDSSNYNEINENVRSKYQRDNGVYHFATFETETGGRVCYRIVKHENNISSIYSEILCFEILDGEIINVEL